MMYDPEQIDALIAERDRLRAEVERAVTADAEWEAIVGMPLPQAIAEAHARIDKGQPYALLDVIGKLRAAHLSVTEDRNLWRTRARRAADVARGRA